MKIGLTDVFEQTYTQRFRDRFSQYGLFLNYERDRAARDIGLHLTRTGPNGSQLVSSAVCWFQLKGIMATSLPREELNRADHISIDLDVVHLRFWYLQPTATYLAVYIECSDTFLVCDIREYVAREWGAKILTDPQKTRRVRVSTQSTLDSTALWQLLTKHDADEWARVFSANVDEARLAAEDYNLIWRLGTADERSVTHELYVVDWLSKTRTELHVREKSSSGDFVEVHQFWAFMLSPDEMLRRMPYLSVVPDETEADDDDDDGWFDEPAPILVLADGSIRGREVAGEVAEYEVIVVLSEVGRLMFSWIEQMVSAGAISIDPDARSFISLAPWHSRSV